MCVPHHPPPQATRLGASLMGEVKEIGGRVLRVWVVESVRPEVALEHAGEGRSDWKTNQHSTFLIANRDGPGRRLNGRLFHECAGDRHVDDSGSTPETSLITNSQQLQSQQTEKPYTPRASGRCCTTDRNNVYG